MFSLCAEHSLSDTELHYVWNLKQDAAYVYHLNLQIDLCL